MINHLHSIEEGIYLPNNFENLLSPIEEITDLEGLNYKALQEFNDELVLLCNSYNGTFDPANIQLLKEASMESIFNYMQKVSNNCQKAWNKFKESHTKDVEKVIEVINKENLPYFNSGFRMQFPVGFIAPLIPEWGRLRDGAKIVILDEAQYNANKPYMENEDAFRKRFYRNYYDENYDDFYDSWKQKVFVKTTGKEVIGQPEVAEFVNFLQGYSNQIAAIGKDIDNINITNKNIKNMLMAVPTEEAFDLVAGLNEIINEYGIQIGSKFKFRDSNAYINKQVKTQTNTLKKEFEKQQKRSAKTDKKYLVTYYSVSMEVISSKMKLCNNIKKQSLKVLRKYISLQPRQIKNNPELGAKYAEMQAQRNANPDFQIKK